MKRLYYIFPALIVLVVIFLRAGSSQDSKTIVVSTSMLESAACEIIPKSQKIKIVRLLPPSSCPGHFDLSPRIIPVLRSAVVVVRHDYQVILDEKIANMSTGDISLLEISTTGSPLIPHNYYVLTEQIGTIVSERYAKISDEITAAQKQAKTRTDFLAETMKNRAETWKGTPIIAAVHMKEFCEWLGFEVVGIIKRSEDTSPQDIKELMSLQVDMIVANLQEGTQGAFSLGEKLFVPVAVLSNFPGVDGYGETYYEFADNNIKRLENAWQMR